MKHLFILLGLIAFFHTVVLARDPFAPIQAQAPHHMSRRSSRQREATIPVSLVGIVWDNTQPLGIFTVNGTTKTVGVGGRLAGYSLLKISKNTVTLKCRQKTHILRPGDTSQL